MIEDCQQYHQWFSTLSMEQCNLEYRGMGFDTLPLRYDTKQPLLSGWPYRESEEMRNCVKEPVNIGLRCGGKSKLAVIDCDEKNLSGTFQNVTAILSGLGIHPGDFPVAQTASGNGRHIYIRLINSPEGNIQRLKKELGAGEFRFGSGAQVVAPPSTINGQRYILIEGSIQHLPRISYLDLAPIFSERNVEARKRIPRNALMLLEYGDANNRYRTRFEGEQAIIAGLINAGFSYPEIKEIFQEYPAFGKYRELWLTSPHRAKKYLLHSYTKALEFCNNNESEGKQLARKALEWAKNRPWPGRGGSSERATYIAHAQIAFKCGQIAYAASCRTLAELANISHMTAANATHRLIDEGLIRLVIPAIGEYANVYRLNQTFTLPQFTPFEEV